MSAIDLNSNSKQAPNELGSSRLVILTLETCDSHELSSSRHVILICDLEHSGQTNRVMGDQIVNELDKRHLESSFLADSNSNLSLFFLAGSDTILARSATWKALGEMIRVMVTRGVELGEEDQHIRDPGQ